MLRRARESCANYIPAMADFTIAVADGLLTRKDSYLDGLAFQQQMEAAS
jgi:hypothetical protein